MEILDFVIKFSFLYNIWLICLKELLSKLPQVESMHSAMCKNISSIYNLAKITLNYATI